MVFRDVERLEIVVIALHLRPLHHVEAHSQKDFLELVEHNGQRMLVAQLMPLARHGHVDALGLEPAFGFHRLELLPAFLDLPFQLAPDLVGQLPDHRTLLSGKLAHLL